MIELTLLQKIAIWFLPILFAITLHEAAHGWIAHLRGDHTAFLAGRVSLNPIRHIDPIGTIIVPGILLATTGFIFGWAKPVPINPTQLRNPRWDTAIVAAAGPLSNLLMAILWAIVARVGLGWITTLQAADEPTQHALWLILMGQAGITINLFLMILNLIPIPPLDGSRIVASLLSPKARFQYLRLERWGFLILLLLLFLGVLMPIIFPIFNAIKFLILSAFGMVA